MYLRIFEWETGADQTWLRNLHAFRQMAKKRKDWLWSYRSLHVLWTLREERRKHMKSCRLHLERRYKQITHDRVFWMPERRMVENREGRCDHIDSRDRKTDIKYLAIEFWVNRIQKTWTLSHSIFELRSRKGLWRKDGATGRMKALYRQHTWNLELYFWHMRLDSKYDNNAKR